MRTHSCKIPAWLSRWAAIACAMVMFSLALTAQPSYQPSPENLKSREWFQQARFGMFIHWGIYSLLGDGEWLAVVTDPAYNEPMEISLAPELEAKLKQIATQTGKGADQVVQELVASYFDHDDWFKQEVEKGLASLARGKSVSHEEVPRS